MNFQKVEFLISAAAPKDFPGKRLPEIAFAGKSNVGKSSVINRILNRKMRKKHLSSTWIRPLFSLITKYTLIRRFPSQ